MSTATGAPVRSGEHTSKQSTLLVFCCTLLGAAAQMLIKTGANHIARPGTLAVLAAMFTSLPLFTGYSLYGVSMVLLVLALRGGELSRLYPVIALTYVWVAVLSVFVLREPMNVWKLSGIALIAGGVGVMGAGEKT